MFQFKLNGPWTTVHGPDQEGSHLMQGTSLRGLIESHGAAGFYHKVCELLNEKQVGVDDFSYYELADACGVLPELCSLRGAGDAPSSQMLSESNPGVGTNLLAFSVFRSPFTASSCFR